MKTTLLLLIHLLVFILLTLLTQVGGVIYLLFLGILNFYQLKSKILKVVLFTLIYLTSTFFIIPIIAKWNGREQVISSKNISPTNYMTILLNRNYVVPQLNQLLLEVSEELASENIKIHYLDASFPFINGFPLLPHLSHNDGRKIDLSFIYENKNGTISGLQKSISGYGVFTEVRRGEKDQPKSCLDNGYFQYDYPKYLTFGSINKDLQFSNKGNLLLINKILKQPQLGKLFIEPHLKSRLNLSHPKIRYHGCKAVRHDDHIHIQL